MGLALLLGTLLIAVGPSMIFFVATVSRRPYLIVISLFGLLQGIISMFVGGVVYSIWGIWATPLPIVIAIINILVLELSRPFVYRMLLFACDKLNAVGIPLSISAPSEQYKLSLCMGMGVGFLNILSIALIPLTSAGYGADYYIPTCNCISIYILVAVESICIMPMHVIWTYLTLCDYSKRYVTVPIVICIWHLVTGVVTQLNRMRNGCYFVLSYYLFSSIVSIIFLMQYVSKSNKLVCPLKKSA